MTSSFFNLSFSIFKNPKNQENNSNEYEDTNEYQEKDSNEYKDTNEYRDENIAKYMGTKVSKKYNFTRKRKRFKLRGDE